MTDLKDKVALVTGGSRGIGKGIARAFAEAGAQVMISSRKAEACEAAAQELAQYGECVALPGNRGTGQSNRANRGTGH